MYLYWKLDKIFIFKYVSFMKYCCIYKIVWTILRNAFSTYLTHDKTTKKQWKTVNFVFFFSKILQSLTVFFISMVKL